MATALTASVLLPSSKRVGLATETVIEAAGPAFSVRVAAPWTLVEVSVAVIDSWPAFVDAVTRVLAVPSAAVVSAVLASVPAPLAARVTGSPATGLPLASVTVTVTVR